jgi:thiamine biosynthesis lipoprotein
MKSYYQTAFALGCDIGLCIVHSNEKSADILFSEMWGIISEFEAKFSRFRADSELTLFNNSAGTARVISDDFKEMLLISNRYKDSTNGIFNIFILPSLQKVGYTHPLQAKTKTEIFNDYTARDLDTNSNVIIKESTAKIPKNTALDLGGIAKGYLADKLADFVEGSVEGYWFSIGGDIIVGGANEFGKKWTIDISSIDESEKIEVSSKQNRYAVATSGILKRRGTLNNKDWHHIIDPKTGLSSKQDIVQSTIVASTATEADILATCSIISGSKNCFSLLSKHKVIDALIQISDKSEEISIMQLEGLIRHTKYAKPGLLINEVARA